MVRDLNGPEIESLNRFLINRSLSNLFKDLVTLNDGHYEARYEKILIFKKKWLSLDELSTKQIRNCIKVDEPICLFKSGIAVNVTESLNIFEKLNKLTSSRHKSLYLRFIHGDIYTNEKLFRFGMRESPNCNHCEGVDTLDHRLLNCEYWNELVRNITGITARLTSSDITNNEPIQLALGAYTSTSITALTIHAELLAMIYQYNSPIVSVARSTHSLLRNLYTKESNVKIKDKIGNLLNDL